jgi:RNA polymerase sigma-70 factor (ECF subfamily)
MTTSLSRGVRGALSHSARLAYAPRMEHKPDDSALMLRYRDGDVAAFETLYGRHKDPLFRYLLRRCRQQAAAEDVFQEVWGRIIKSRDNYRPTAKFTTFLYHVAHNCFVDHLRRNTRHGNTADVEPDSQADGADCPETLVEKSLARRRLDIALRSLPDEQRDVFLLYEEAGLSLDEIAKITDCKRETAKSRLRYAIRKLRAALDESPETP